MSDPSCSACDNSGAIIQQNDYNPWGASVHGNGLISGNYPYLYGGKESLAELSYHTGPYNYCPGNPLSAVDPDGLTDYVVNGKKRL